MKTKILILLVMLFVGGISADAQLLKVVDKKKEMKEAKQKKKMLLKGGRVTEDGDAEVESAPVAIADEESVVADPVDGVVNPNGVFEGEIVYETFENYSDYILKMPNSVYVNGVHKMRLIVKGDKMHMIDETTKCHTIVDGTYTYFCEITKTALQFKSPDYFMAAIDRDQELARGQKNKLVSNTYAKTSKKETINGNECTLYEGDIIHDAGSMSQKYSMHAYCTDIKAPYGYRYHMWGAPVDKIASKWILKYDGGSVAMLGIGELSFYMEGDVISVNPRAVSDSEFTVPSDIKVSSGSLTNVFKLMGFFKGIKKALEKAGIKGGDKDAKTTGVHFKTQDEWDF